MYSNKEYSKSNEKGDSQEYRRYVDDAVRYEIKARTRSIMHRTRAKIVYEKAEVAHASY
jgi:hypothetical protein